MIRISFRRFTLIRNRSVRLFSERNYDLLNNYKEQVVNGKLNFDENQHKILTLFAKLKLFIETDNDIHTCNEATGQQSQSLERRLRGVYLYGEVGTGKTMLMDMFYNSLHNSILKKRVHFHDFMLEVHQRIFEHKQLLLKTKGRKMHIHLEDMTNPEVDSITYVAHTIIKEAKILCFDEFQVTDICDAMILNKLFSILWQANTLLIATSNRAPDNLYLNGLNRQYFLPFIHALKQECMVRNINSHIDYRKNMNTKYAYNMPNSDEMKNKIWLEFLTDVQLLKQQQCSSGTNGNDSTVDSVVDVDVLKSVTIPVMMGRTLTVQYAYIPTTSKTVNKTDNVDTLPTTLDSSSTNIDHCSGNGNCSQATLSTPIIQPTVVETKGVAWCDFNSLCQTDKGAADYSALCIYFHAVYLFGVPRLSVLMHNEARRFITLIDELYNANVRFIYTAETTPCELFEILSTERLKEEKPLFGTDHVWGVGEVVSDEVNNIHTEQSKSQQNNNNSIINQHKHSRNAEQLHISVPTTSTTPAYTPADTTSSVAVVVVDAAESDFKVLQGELASIQDLSFAFKRAASRLTEMSSVEYYDKWKHMYTIM